MKKLYSEFAAPCVKPCLSAREGNASSRRNRAATPLVTTVPIRSFPWPSIVPRQPARSATRWIE